MTEHAIYITANDAAKLRDLISQAQHSDYRKSSYLQSLSNELDRAVIVEAQKIPPDVITMNSQASLIDVETGEEMLYTLVFPDDADAMQGKISVLAPIGTAMLGYRVGGEFEWDTPGGKLKMRVTKVVYQPEASGDMR
jgi:regulator of nucleoside diphosphate kinase